MYVIFQFTERELTHAGGILVSLYESRRFWLREKQFSKQISRFPKGNSIRKTITHSNMFFNLWILEGFVD